jgi:cell division septum initiation protein DivIVA
MSDPLLDEIDDALARAAREIEALRDERAQLKAEIDYLRASFTKACKTLGEAEAERDRLREALKEALDSWQEAAQYKGEYFLKKHGDMEEIAELRKLLAKEAGQ